jgi:hypothetical protein
MVNYEELKRKYDLVANEQYQCLRDEQLNLIVEKANSPLSSDIIRGMLLLINETDKWEQDFLAARKKIEE